jgi:hypothetical protein
VHRESPGHRRRRRRRIFRRAPVEAGADVTFLVRERRARQLAENGLVIKSAVGDAAMRVRTLAAADPAGRSTS